MVFKFFKAGLDLVKTALVKTSAALTAPIRKLFSGRQVDEELLEELESILYGADLGVKTAQELIEEVRKLAKEHKNLTAELVLDKLAEKITALLAKQDASLKLATSGPTVILIVGVNGNGKTTSIAKLAHLFQQEGKKVLLAAADTYRAAAADQLAIWAERVGCDIVRSQSGTDPSAVVFDALTAGKARGADVVLIDTAGRLQNKTALMQELEKMLRVAKKVMPDAPHETLLVVDATTGQNAIDQALAFHKHTPLTGLILTKVDSTAKGGVIVALQRTLPIPVKFLGLGEQVGDLRPFEPASFAAALLGK